MTQELLQRVLALYTPPFHYERGTVYPDVGPSYERGYIFDAKGQHVGSNHPAGEGEPDLILRVQGWTNLLHRMDLPEAEAVELTDAIGQTIATALNEYWERGLVY